MSACICAGILVLVLAWFKLSSLDIGYHVAYGRHFLDHGEIVGFRPDPFLMPETAVPFVNANWGSQVVMALAERAGGAAGLTALRIGLIVAMMAAIAVTVRAYTANLTAVALAWLIASLGAYERFSMRPELFSYAIMLVQLAIMVRMRRVNGMTVSVRAMVALVILQIAWVNFHSYFLVGVLTAGAFCLDAAWQAFRSRRIPSDRMFAIRDFRRKCILTALTVVACFAHPWGYRAAVFPLRTLAYLQSQEVMGGAPGESAKSAWAEISEFQSPFEFWNLPINRWTIRAYAVVVALSAAGVALLVRRGAVGPAVIVLMLFLMSTQMRRNIAQFSLAAAPLSIATLHAISTGLRLKMVRKVLVGGIGLGSLAGAAAVASGHWYFSERRISREFGFGYSESAFSRRAASWLTGRSELKPNLFVDYFASSNTLPWLDKRFKLFVDTNTFAYREETLRLAYDIGLGKVPHGPFFDQYGINAVLLHGGPDTQMLIGAMTRDSGEWALVHVDSTAVIFVRRIPEHVPVIVQHEARERDVDVREWIASLSGPSAARAMAIGSAASIPISLGWWSSAAVLCEEAVGLRPDYTEAWINLGLCQGNLANAAARAGHGDEALRLAREAIRSFERATVLEPENAVAKENLRRARASIGEK